MTDNHSEFARIERIRELAGLTSPQVDVGIGDDAAVVEETRLLCSDAFVEGVHFDFSYMSASDVGHKAMASCLSDIAAMGGWPQYALISIAWPRTRPQSEFEMLYAAIVKCGHKFSVDIVGGDLSASRGGVFIDVSIIGEALRPILRSGAKSGDIIAVSGWLGTSARGLELLQTGQSGNTFLRERHAHPNPRFDLLDPQFLGTATSLIDISDGLSSELHHLARASDLPFEIEAALLPLAPELADSLGSREQALPYLLHGGEEYELLATLDSALVRDKGMPKGFTVIGHVGEGSPGVSLIGLDGQKSRLEARGFDHFKDVPIRDA